SFRPPLSLLLFPYTTLFRSLPAVQPAAFPLRGRERRPALPLLVPAPSAGRGATGWRDPGGCQPAGGPGPARRVASPAGRGAVHRSEEHTSELQSRENLVCRL